MVMPMPSRFEGDVIIRKIRNAGSSGGVIFSCVSVAEKQKQIRFIVKAHRKLAPSSRLFRENHQWFVNGSVSLYKTRWNDGSIHEEWQLEAEQLSFRAAASENLKALLLNVAGVGETKAEKIARLIGKRLYQIAATDDWRELEQHCTAAVAERIVNKIRDCDTIAALQLFDEVGVPPHIARQAIDIWSDRAYSIISKNPYLLVSFEPSMTCLDAVAQDRLGFSNDSPERLIAFAKSVLFGAFDQGHTCLPVKIWQKRLANKIGNTDKLGSKELALKAIEYTLASGDAVLVGDYAQVGSMHIIETSVIENVRALRDREFDISEAPMNAAITDIQSIAGFDLTCEQRNAVTSSVRSGVTLLTGGAGCGKTTALEAICSTLENTRQTSQIFMMAIAGQAAKRITEATGRDAMTIASFLYHVESSDINDDAVIIVDEASMLDILSFNMILKKVPKRGRLILTGDPEQISPVGIGLTLHLLITFNLVNPNLSIVKRQAESTGIPQVANAVKEYHVTKQDIELAEFSGKGTGVSFIDTSEQVISRTVIDIYEELGGDGSNNDVFILSATRNNIGGVIELNRHIHDRVGNKQKIVFGHSEFGEVNALVDGVALCIGDLVMARRNDYVRDFRNGSIGQVIGFNDEEQQVMVDFEGNVVALQYADVNDLNLAYVSTMHKSQGSQFDRVVVVMKQSRILDRHLIYTAITRAKLQVVIIGDRRAFESALCKSKALSRYTLLSEYYKQQENGLGVENREAM